MENSSTPTNSNPLISNPTTTPVTVTPPLTTSLTSSVNPVLSSNPNTPPMPPVPKKKMPRIVSILIVLLLLVAGGAFVFKYVQKPAIAPEEPMISPLPVETAMPTVDSSMEGWKTYTNLSYGYSLKFPKELRTQLQVAGAGDQEANEQARSLYIYDPVKDQHPTGYIFVQIEVFDTKPTFGAEWKEETTIVGGRSATKHTYKVGVADSDIYLIKMTNGYLQLLVSTESARSELANQILSTFEFTDGISAIKGEVEYLSVPSNWEVVQNSPNSLKSKNVCYRIDAKKIGKLNMSIDDYLLEKHGAPIVSLTVNTNQYVWQGIESYTIPPNELGGAKSVYVRPGDVDWYTMTITYIGAGEGTTNPPGYCSQEEKDIEPILRNVKFL